MCNAGYVRHGTDQVYGAATSVNYYSYSQDVVSERREGSEGASCPHVRCLPRDSVVRRFYTCAAGGRPRPFTKTPLQNHGQEQHAHDEKNAERSHHPQAGNQAQITCAGSPETQPPRSRAAFGFRTASTKSVQIVQTQKLVNAEFACVSQIRLCMTQ